MHPRPRYAMKKLLLASCLAFAALNITTPAAAAPAAENAGSTMWWSYLADYKGTPGSILVDMGQIALATTSASRRKFPCLITAGTIYRSDDKNQLPAPDELARLEALSRHVLAAMARHGRIVHAGTFTHKREQVLYLYVEKPDGFEAAFTKALKEGCAGCEKIFSTRDDPQWEVYREFLYPNTATLLFYNYHAPAGQPQRQ